MTEFEILAAAAKQLREIGSPQAHQVEMLADAAKWRAAPKCPECDHPWYVHEKHVERWFDGKPADTCLTNVGMGDPCGCMRRKPEGLDA